MGRALITGGGTDGRYTVRLDFGEAQRAALYTAAAAAVATLETRIAQQQEVLNVADAYEASLRQDLSDAFEFLRQTLEANPAGSGPAQKVFDSILRDYRKVQAQNQPARTALVSLKAAKATALLRQATWQNLGVIETRSVWCVTFTENAAGTVATLELPGEPGLIVLAPYGRAHIPVIDGAVLARELMSPAQAFFNAAILPGWQKHKPLYRWGTLTSIDWDGNVGNVTLGAALSSARRLDVNDRPTLTGVPFEYMQSDCRAFNDDSRVVVELRQGWAAPRIIGFLDNPRPDPPTLAPAAVFSRSWTQDETVSADYSGNWTAGADPRTYSLQAGALPGGVTLNTSTGVISGTPTAQSTNSGIVIRCADTFYDPAKNRRYEDSEPFQILVYGGWTFYSGTLDAAFHTFDGEHGVDISTGISPGLDEYFLQSEKWTTGVGEEILDQFTWVEGIDEPGFPDLWVRLDYTGDAPSGSAASTWLTGASGLWTWRTESGSPGTIVEASYTVRWSRESDGSDVVATVTGSVYVEYPP